MGKKRIVTTAASAAEAAEGKKIKLPKLKQPRGVLYIQSTYNNTLMSLSDPQGNVLTAASSGALGFKGTKKGTPFAASKVGEALAERAAAIGIKEVEVAVSGVGAGRESAIRSFASRGGINILSLRDATPLPHNGPRPKKPRRV